MTAEEPALASLQTLEEPQRLSIMDMPHPHADSARKEVCERRTLLLLGCALETCRSILPFFLAFHTGELCPIGWCL